jgi:hypothetical protein
VIAKGLTDPVLNLPLKFSRGNKLEAIGTTRRLSAPHGICYLQLFERLRHGVHAIGEFLSRVIGAYGNNR